MKLFKMGEDVVLSEICQEDLTLKDGKITFVVPKQITKFEIDKRPVLTKDIQVLDISQNILLDNLQRNLIFPFIEELVLPLFPVKVGVKSFANSDIKKIVNSESITIIDDNAFASCYNLKSFDFANVTIIGDESFSKSGLCGKIVFGDKLRKIGQGCFSRTEVESIEFNSRLNSVYKVFSNMNFLKYIVFNELINTATEILFKSKCLEEIKFSKINSFSQTIPFDCPNLDLNLPKDCFVKINDTLCESLSKLKSLTFYAEKADIMLKGNLCIETVNIFRNGEKLTFRINEGDKLYVWNNNVFYLSNNYLHVFSDKYGTQIFKAPSNNILVPRDEEQEELFFMWNDKLKQINKEKNQNYLLPCPGVMLNGNINKMEDYLKNYRQYNVLCKMTGAPEGSIFNICSNLGMFEYPKDEKNKEENVKYEKIRARVFEFIKYLDAHNLYLNYAMGFVYETPYNPRRTEFILRNIKDVMPYPKDVIYNFFRTVFSNYNKVETYHKNKSGKYTRFDLDEFYRINNALNNYDQNDPVVSILSPYTSKKNVYEFAKKYYDIGCKLQERIEGTNEDLFGDIVDPNETGYTFEFLKHNDPRNLILGYECDSCAKPDESEMGHGILEASMSDPRYCNVVLFDKNKRIIGKITFYVKDQIAVINSLELKRELNEETYSEFYEILNSKTKNQIIDTINRAVNGLAQNYLIKTGKPLLSVAIGLDTNDLRCEYVNSYGQIKENDPRLLPMPDFQHYAMGHNAQSQSIIFGNDVKCLKDNDFSF